jgi:hypothetical protein
MIIETKYDIGDKLFYIDLWENRVRIKLGTIKQINARGKVWEEYDLGGVTRPEGELWKDFNEAKKEAAKKQEERNEKLMQWVDEISEQDVDRR